MRIHMADSAGRRLPAGSAWDGGPGESARRSPRHFLTLIAPTAADRIPAFVTAIAVIGTASLLVQHLADQATDTVVAPFLLLATAFGVSGRLVTRLGPGAFPIVVATRSFALLLGLLVAPPFVVVAAHALGGTLAAIAIPPRHAWPAAARLSTAVYGTAVGAWIYTGVVTGTETFVAWWAAAFAAVLAATLLGTIGLALE